MEHLAINLILATLLVVDFYFGRKALEEQAALFAVERSDLLDRIARVSLAKSLSEYVASGDEEPCRTWDGDLSVDPEERDIDFFSEKN
tara:strand:+ start:2796 stop:3059 length:264 start_codon:yes stop_codon:yes gene_type:complete